MNEAFFIPEAFFKAENKVMYGRVVVLEWDEEYTYMYSCSSCGMFCIVSVVIPQNNELLKLKFSLDSYWWSTITEFHNVLGKYEFLSVNTTLNHHNACIQ